MSKIEFKNPNPHAVQLAGPDKKLVLIQRNATAILSDWFMRYVPRDLQVVRAIDGNVPVFNKNPGVKIQPLKQANPRTRPPHQTSKPIHTTTQPKVAGRIMPSVRPAQQIRSGIIRPGKASRVASSVIRQPRGPVVGHTAGGDPHARYRQALGSVYYPISNDIGVGILSYNRLPCVQKLLASIRQHTDLSRTTIFVSDESSDGSVKAWLKQQPDIVLLDNSQRLGIAGNSNRLLKCLSRFKYKLILNDDVVVLKPGWETFYFDSMCITGYHHFCYRHSGICGAKNSDGIIKDAGGGISIQTIAERPQGAVLAFDNIAFDKVGYFDEQFGVYGMEHVDWSRRISLSGIQPTGYHDICGAENYFSVSNSESAVAEKSTNLHKARTLFDSLPQSSRIYVQASAASNVPSISYVIPCRNVSSRNDSIITVINNIKAQRFPNVEIIISEQDSAKRIMSIPTCKYVFIASKIPAQPFIKSAAFNKGVKSSSSDYLILHDADILVPGTYTQAIYDLLQTNNSCHIGKQVLYLTQQSSDKVNDEQHVDTDKQCEKAVDYFVGGSLGAKKSVYMAIGGFDENFIGYGCEDVEFFDRLKGYGGFYNNRTIDMVHLWHDRTSDWQSCHANNKSYMQSIAGMPSSERYRMLSEALRTS